MTYLDYCTCPACVRLIEALLDEDHALARVENFGSPDPDEGQ